MQKHILFLEYMQLHIYDKVICLTALLQMR